MNTQAATLPLADPAAHSPGGLQVLRWTGIAALFAFALFFITMGTIETRILYSVLFLLGFANPAWGILSFALLGPMLLQDAGKTHTLLTSELIVAGIMAGALRQWNPGGPSRSRRVVHYGLWPHYLLGLFLLLFASSFIGIQLVMLRENFVDGISGWYYRLVMICVGSAAEPEWALRSLWNWTTGMVVAVVAARRMDDVLTARWLKLCAVAMAVSCGFALLDWLRLPEGWTKFSLEHLRRVNFDPVLTGRLQGTAGHPGWFAQWIVLMWPGLLLWWSPGRTKRNAVVLSAIAVCGLALILSAARAAWLGMLVSGALAIVLTIRHYPGAKRHLPLILGGGAVIMVIALLIGGNYLWYRLDNLLRAEDRANYYVTGLMFLRLFPFGLGLGTHYRFYGAMVPPDYRWGQFDYVDSHNLLLHTLVENGPFIPLLIIAGAVGLLMEVRRAWRVLTLSEKEIVGALSLSLVGTAVVSIAQYIVYIRVVELSLWMMVGTLVGMCRSRTALYGERLDSPRGQRLLLGCGVAAALVASMNSGRIYADRVPRNREVNEAGELTIWTGADWRMAIENDVDYIAFDLYRPALPANVTITWPDGSVEHAVLTPEPLTAPIHERRTSARFEFRREPRPARWYEAQGWLRMEVTPLWTPAEIAPDATDTRGLGVYINGLKLESERRRALARERAGEPPAPETE